MAVSPATAAGRSSSLKPWGRMMVIWQVIYGGFYGHGGTQNDSEKSIWNGWKMDDDWGYIGISIPWYPMGKPKTPPIGPKSIHLDLPQKLPWTSAKFTMVKFVERGRMWHSWCSCKLNAILLWSVSEIFISPAITCQKSFLKINEMQ